MNHNTQKKFKKQGEKGATFKDRSVESEGRFPAAFLEAADALDALRNFGQDLGVDTRPRIWVPMQYPVINSRKLRKSRNLNEGLGFRAIQIIITTE